jgi:hypothetical protein
MRHALTSSALLILLAAAAGPAAAQPSQPAGAPRPGTVVAPGTTFTPVPEGQATAPPRDTGARPAPVGTARIRGRITDQDTGQGLRRAIVSVSLRPAATPSSPLTATTDDQGRYEVRDVPAGEFGVLVRKSGYAMRGYGQRRAAEPPRFQRIAEGQTLEGIDVALQRGGVVTGRVVDEAGEPVLDGYVQVLQLRWLRGQRRAQPVSGSPTNDLGAYRIFGLTPGEYLVSAAPRGYAAELDGRTEYATIYYPGTAELAQARPLTVSASQETIADFTLAPVPVVRASGIVLDAAGKPAAVGRVMAVPRGDDTPSSFTLQRNAAIKPDGTFSVPGLTPGAWRLSTSTGFGFGPVGGTDVLAAQLDITVGDQPVEGLVLALSRGGTLRGRIVAQGGPPPDMSAFSVMARPIDVEGVILPSGPGRVNADGTFEVAGLFGRRLPMFVSGSPQSMMMGSAPAGWHLEAVLVGGRDVQDVGIEVAPGRVATADIVITREGTEMSGTVTTSKGAPVADCVVVALAEDREKWFVPSGRFFRVTRGGADGRFDLKRLPPGDYRVVALPVDRFDGEAVGDPRELERLHGIGTPVTLADREKKTLTLRLAEP